jgi:hypothetical protein
VPPRGRPGPHPPPPADLAKRQLPIERVAGPLFRVHRARHGALFFGTSGENRFDDPRKEYGVLYAGLSPACAFIETFGEPLDVPFVTEAQLAERKLTLIEARAPLRLVDLRGPKLRRLGADARLFAGDHDQARPGRAPSPSIRSGRTASSTARATTRVSTRWLCSSGREAPSGLGRRAPPSRRPATVYSSRGSFRGTGLVC